LDAGADADLRVFGYTPVLVKQFLTYSAVLFSLGFLKLLFYWLPKWELQATHKACPLSRAKKVLIRDRYKADYERFYVKPVLTAKAGQKELLEVPKKDSSEFSRVESYRFFRCQKIAYLWDDDSLSFYPIHGLDRNAKLSLFRTLHGLTRDEQARR